MLLNYWLLPIRALKEVEEFCHITRTAGWLPPIENWVQTIDLPYGWEKAIDLKGQPYYIK
ncbi:conserved hypothetical protein [Culex quinquefasciatus]|uniref:WW domain-containing protein n=1 Tax=Culex quinquefasciatus TaxID=7176 RepID=B0X590_CULQU|nr:conserved hypothetical protein [Culex quinquefasciatus]|eukprot:XP_001864812.1 conserved hypothetical protein [Culex quinquefasciatus]